MSLESEITDLISRHVAADPLALSLLTGEITMDEATVTPDDLFRVLVRVVNAEREAILRLAREIDDLRAP